MDYIQTKVSDLLVGYDVMWKGFVCRVITKLGPVSVRVQKYKKKEVAAAAGPGNRALTAAYAAAIVDGGFWINFMVIENRIYAVAPEYRTGGIIEGEIQERVDIINPPILAALAMVPDNSTMESKFWVVDGDIMVDRVTT